MVLPLFWLSRVVDAEAQSPGDALNAVRHALNHLMSAMIFSIRSGETHKSGGARLLFFRCALYNAKPSVNTHGLFYLR